MSYLITLRWLQLVIKWGFEPFNISYHELARNYAFYGCNGENGSE